MTIRNRLLNVKNRLQSVKSDDARQKDYFLMLESACKVSKPIFINRNVEAWAIVAKQAKIPVWAVNEDELVTAANVSVNNAVGRYRVDFSNSSDVVEIWIEIEANKDFRDKESVKKHWADLAKAAKKVVAAFNAFGVSNDYIVIKTSGRGLHFSVFCSGFRDEKQYIDAMTCIQKTSGLSMNVKQSESKGAVFGFDSPAIASSRRKIRELGGQNDKLVGLTHYVSQITDLDAKTYPFITKAKDVVYPQEIKVFHVDKDFINKMLEYQTAADTKDSVEKDGKVVYDRDGDIELLYQCPLVKKIVDDVEHCKTCTKFNCHECEFHAENPHRIFLSQTFTFFGEAGEAEIHKILHERPDYSEKYTQNQIENVKKNNRKPVTCKWAQDRKLCPPDCNLKCKTIVNLAWKKPDLDNLRKEIMAHVKLVDEDLDVVDFMLATGVERRYWPTGDSLWCYLVAVSGSGKTELMRLMEEWRYTYTIDEITKASMISGYRTPGDTETTTYGVLEDFDDKSVYVKDMSQILTGNKDERNAVFGTLRNVYDGEVSKGFGNLKGKLNVKSKFGLFMGMTPIIDAYYALSNQLGERFIKVRFTCEENVVLKNIFKQQNDEYLQERRRLQRKINEFLQSIEIVQYQPPVEHEQLILDLVKFTASMRTALFVQSEGDNISFRGSRELPSRLLNQSKKLWTIMACIRGKDKITLDEIGFVGKVLIQTPPLYRIQAFYHLLKNEKATVNSLASDTHIDSRRAELLMNELYFLEIALQNDDGSYTLNPYFKRLGTQFEALGWYKWLTTKTEEFDKYKHAIPEKRRERGLDSNWLKAENLVEE